MADRFYTPLPLAAGDFTLDGPEAHHLSSVRRFAAGDRVTLFNGDGHDYPAEVVGVGKKSVALAVAAGVPADRERQTELWVASALPKGDRADFLIEKLTELGVTRFIPLVTARSVVVPKAAVVEKFERMVVEASKQCGRNRLMRIDPPQAWAAFLARTDLPADRVVLHTADATTYRPALGPRVVAVGPEGGFAAEEVAAAVGWTHVSLGARVLRTETAAIAACLW